jgi:hypothetical protein
VWKDVSLVPLARTVMLAEEPSGPGSVVCRVVVCCLGTSVLSLRVLGYLSRRLAPRILSVRCRRWLRGLLYSGLLCPPPLLPSRRALFLSRWALV